MEDKGKLDLDTIAQECDLFDCSNFSETLSKINALENHYGEDELIEIYNYFLANCTTPELLCELIRLEDKYRNKSSLPILVDILLCQTGDEERKEDFTNVRVMAAKAIANLKDTSAVNSLLYCLNNKNENYKVRFACADALGKIGDRFAVAPLIEVVKDEGERSLYLRESAASALGMLGDIRAVDPLVSILETKNGLLDKFTFLKERVIEALGKLRLRDNERVNIALKRSLMDESPQIRINAIEALMENENPESFDVIKSCLKDKDNEVQRNALIALYNLSDRSILDEVIQNPDYSDFLKMEAVSIIEEYEDANE